MKVLEGPERARSCRSAVLPKRAKVGLHGTYNTIDRLYLPTFYPATTGRLTAVEWDHWDPSANQAWPLPEDLCHSANVKAVSGWQEEHGKVFSEYIYRHYISH